MSKRLFVSAISVLLIAFGSISTAFAQGASGLVDGQFVDASGSGIAGVSVTLSDSSSGLTRTTTSNSGGNFRMQLPPGVYVLNSTKGGYSSVTIDQVMVNLGVTTELTIPVKDDTIEVITTYGTATELIDLATGETSLNISLAEIERLPVPRNIESVALLAPGVMLGDNDFGTEGAAHHSLVSFSGASVAENVYYINGMNVTNFRNGLGGSSIPFEFYDQFQIKTGGYSAEFGRSLGGVLNAVTKTGSNDFEYGAVTYFSPESLGSQSPNTLNRQGTLYDLNSENDSSSYTADFYVSGPIIKDRLFFYALYEFEENSMSFTDRAAPENFNDRKIEDDFWGANLLWNITDSHSVSYTTFTDERERINTQSDFDVDARSVGDQTGIAIEKRGGDNHIFRYDGQITDTFSVSALYGKNEYSLDAGSDVDGQCPYTNNASTGALVDPGTGLIVTSASPGCWANSRATAGADDREAYRLDLKWYIGNHQLRIGFDDETNTSTGTDTYPGYDFRDTAGRGVYYRYTTRNVGSSLSNGATIPDANGDGSAVDVVRWRISDVGGEFETNSTAWYVEDTWDITDDLSLSVGVRNETFENLNSNGDTFIEIEDQWGPRLGLTWSPGGSDKKVFGTWGRYHIPVANNTNVRLAGPEDARWRYFVFDGAWDPVTGAPTSIGADGVPTLPEIGTELELANGIPGDSAQLADQNIEPMYHDELILGYEQGLGNSDWVAGIRYVSRDLKSAIDDVLTDDAVDALGYEFTGDAGGYVLANPGSDITIEYDRYDTGVLETTTFPADLLLFDKAQREYTAVELTLAGYGDDWSFNTSYVHATSRGNTEGYVKSDNGQDDAGITQDFDQWQLMDGAYGSLPNDRRHTVKAYGNYQVNDKLLLGANMFLQSGRPRNSFGTDHPDSTPYYGDTFYLYDTTSEVFNFTPRGSAGRTEWVTRFDLSAIYSFEWGDRANVELRAEIFNVMDAKSATELNEFAEDSVGVGNPDFGSTQFYQAPRYVRFGATMRF